MYVNFPFGKTRFAWQKGGQPLFGYIKPVKQELKIKDYEAYQGVYCGLCKQLGRVYGPFYRFTLSYDFAFLAMLSMALGEEPPPVSPGKLCGPSFKKAGGVPGKQQPGQSGRHGCAAPLL